MKNFEDLELLSLSDREAKAPSRRSVRIETPFSVKSEKSSSNNSSASVKRSKSTVLLSPMSSSKGHIGSERTGDEILDIEGSNKEKTNDLSNCGITIPKPFQMTIRYVEWWWETNRLSGNLCKKTYNFRDEENQIVEKCMLEINTNKNKEKSEMFRAHPVPIESQIPLFDRIMADQEYK